MSVSKDVIKRLFLIVGIGTLLFILLSILIGAVTSDAADLKCVTIKFKNDSELKLKTQWFVNAPDTTIDCRWSMLDFHTPEDFEAMLDFYRFGYKRDLRRIRRDSLFFEIHICDTTYWDKTLLFPPDVRKEPTSKRVYNDDGSWDCITTKGKIDEDGWQQYFMIPVRDTIPGEALLWYEENRLTK